MNKLIIVGAGDFGRETLQWALQSHDYHTKWQIAGFLSGDLHRLDNYESTYPILGRVEDWIPAIDERFVVAIGAPEVKEKIVQLLLNKGAVFENVIHESVVLASTAKLGQGLIICPHVVISDSALIGDHVIINNNACIGHDACIGKYTTINSLCDITGRVSIGQSVFIGSSSNIIPQCHIGDQAYIGAGSVVMNSLPSCIRVLGNPAKKFEIKGS